MNGIFLGTALELWTEHNLVSVDGTPLLIYGHATLRKQTYSLNIVVLGTVTTRAILWHRFSYEVQWNSRCRKGTAYARQSSTP